MKEYYIETSTGNATITPGLRYIIRDGREILQQALMHNVTKAMFWRDVPVVCSEDE